MVTVVVVAVVVAYPWPLLLLPPGLPFLEIPATNILRIL